MSKFAVAMLAAVTLIQPALSVGADKPIDSGAKPTSFVPQARTKQHVYGAPIEPAILGHAKSHKHTPKK